MQECDLQRMLTEREAVLSNDYAAALSFADFDVSRTVLDVATGC